MQDDMNSPQTNRVAFEDIFRPLTWTKERPKLLALWVPPAAMSLPSVNYWTLVCK